MAEKIGVYFDESSVGKKLNLEELIEGVKTKWADLCPVVTSHPNLASEEGKQLIKDDVDQGTIDSVCICGTSPRMDSDLFTFGSNILVERVNLREQTVYGIKDPEEVQKAARDYVNMGIAKLQKTLIPEAEPVDSIKAVLVIGGGWTGLSAATYAANAGYDVFVVEKESELGGYAAKLHKTIPLAAPYDRVQDTGIDKKIAAVENNEKITVHTGTTIKKITGAPGKYEVTLKSGETFSVGAIVLAAGWMPQDTKYLEPFGYGTIKNVVTTMEVEEMAKNGGIKKPSDGQAPDSALFLLSTSDKFEPFAEAEAAAAEAEEEAEEETEASGEEGEEEESKFVFKKNLTYKHLPYSSETASLNALKQAGYLREAYPDSKAFIIYEHMMIPGMNELYYKAAQDDPGIMMSKGEVQEIKEDSDGGVLVTFKDTLLGEDIEIKTDMLVVPTGMVPATSLKPVLELAYRQGPAIPDLDLFDGFADSNYICFPYETRRTGVYAAGAVRQPMTLHLAEVDAAGAALKAIQCLESANRGMSVHPRSGDLTYPKFNFVRCTQCKRCTEECPFGVLDEDEKGTPMPNPSRCRRCGTCMGACPERVISFDNYSVDIVGSMIRQIKVPDDMEAEGPRAIVLACENDAYPALDMAGLRGKPWSPYVRIIPVRCLGSVNTIWIADALGKGVDGIMLLGCKYGEDYQCHFIKGSELCNRRMDNVGETLERLGVEKERVVQEQVAIDEYDTVSEKIDKFIDHLIELGPNPYKGY